jgi:F0F1-type ATP synthase gamma subunit
MEGMEMSDHYEYYLNNPHERKVDYEIEDEYIEDKIEEAADNKDFVWELLAEQYVDFELTQTTLRAMFKSYVTKMNATKQADKDQADADLLIFTKALMGAMYQTTVELVEEHG